MAHSVCARVCTSCVQCVCVCVCVGSWRHTSTRLSRASRLSQQLNCNMYSCFSTITCLLFLDYHNNSTATCIVVLRVSLKDLQRCSIPNNVYALIAWPTQITQEREWYPKLGATPKTETNSKRLVTAAMQGDSQMQQDEPHCGSSAADVTPKARKLHRRSLNSCSI